MYLSALMVAFIQGVTEFLPVSSSAHLLLWNTLFAKNHMGLMIDVAAHFGTLLAIMWYERHMLLEGTKAFLKQCKTPNITKFMCLDFVRMAWVSLPVVLVGAALASSIDLLRTPFILGASSIIFGVLLGVCDRMPVRSQASQLKDLSVRQLLALGFFQIFALVPGVSRSGIVMTTARVLGFSRLAAAKISFLMAMPVLFAAGTWLSYQLFQHHLAGSDILYFIIVMFFSALVAHIVILFFMRFIKRWSLQSFMWYRILFGLFIIYTFW